MVIDGKVFDEPIFTFEDGTTKFTLSSEHLEENEISFFPIVCEGVLAKNTFEMIEKGQTITIMGNLRTVLCGKDGSGNPAYAVTVKATTVRYNSPKKSKVA